MLIDYLAFLNPYSFDGGGEKVMRELLDAGTARGHRINIHSVLGSREQESAFREESDLWILTDIYNCAYYWKHPVMRIASRIPGTRINRYWKILDRVIRSKKYVHFDNSYVDICDLPYLPCNGEVSDFRCRNSNDHRPRDCFGRFTRKMYINSRLNIFVSPLHREVVQKVIGKEAVGRYFELRPTVNVNMFRNMGMKRDIDNLYVGVICEAKGIANLKAMFPDGNVVLVGPNISGDISFGQQLGPVPYEQVPILMNHAINFVHLPRWPEPMGRVVVEAALCGCNLITNKNVGACSFGFDLANPQNYAGAIDDFWNVLEKV